MTIKHIVTLLLILLYIPLSAAHPESYWNKRLDRTNAERKSLEQSGVSPLTAAFFINEAGRCKEASELSRVLSDNPASLSESSHIVTSAELRSMAGEIASRLCAYRTLESLFSSPSNEDHTAVRNSIEAYILSSASGKGIAPDKTFISDIIRSAPYSDASPLEYALRRISALHETEIQAETKKAEDLLVKMISPGSKPVTESFLAGCRKKTISALLAEPSDTAQQNVKIVLTSLGTARKNIDGRISRLSSVKNLLGDRAPVRAGDLSSILNKPETLDIKVFSSLTQSLCDNRTYIRETGEKKILPLPKDPDCAFIFLSIDKARRKALSLSAGNDFAAAISDFEKTSQQILTDSFRDSSDIFFKESEKSRITDASLSPEFQQSKIIFTAKLDGAKKYRDQSISFLKVFTRESPETSIESVRTKMLIINEALTLVKNNAAICEASAYREFSYTPQLSASFKRFLSRIESIASVSKTERVGLSKTEIRDLLDSQTITAHKTRELQQTVSPLFTESAAVSRKNKSSTAGASAGVSQKEIDAVAQSLTEKSKALESLKETQTMLNSYAELFDKLETAASSGRADDFFNKVMKDRSLITSVTGMNMKKIFSENAERSYLIKKMDEDIAFIKSQTGASSVSSPLTSPVSEKELAGIKSQMKTTPSIKISGRIMHEKNIGEMDRFAYNILETKYRRATWGKDAPMKNDRTNIESQGVLFSAVLPEGFSEAAPPFNPQEHSVIKYYTDAENSRSIIIALAPAAGKPSDIIRDWVVKIGRTPSSKEYPKIRYVALAVTASKKDTVMDAYIFEKNGAHLIIAGECLKTKRGFFQGTIRSVVSSVEFE